MNAPTHGILLNARYNKTRENSVFYAGPHARRRREAQLEGDSASPDVEE